VPEKALPLLKGASRKGPLLLCIQGIEIQPPSYLLLFIWYAQNTYEAYK
jgi:hypothetical protein